MLAFLEYLTISFLAMFVIVNPLTTAFIFMAFMFSFFLGQFSEVRLWRAARYPQL